MHPSSLSNSVTHTASDVAKYTKFALRDAVVVVAPETMPHTKPWNEEEWNQPLPHDWPEWLPEPVKEMRKPECADEQATKFDALVFRLGSPTGSLVVLDRDDAHEYSRLTCHESIYCIRQDEVYTQGDAAPLDEYEDARVDADLEAVFRQAAAFARRLAEEKGQESAKHEGGGKGQKRKRGSEP